MQTAQDSFRHTLEFDARGIVVRYDAARDVVFERDGQVLAICPFPSVNAIEAMHRAPTALHKLYALVAHGYPVLACEATIAPQAERPKTELASLRFAAFLNGRKRCFPFNVEAWNRDRGEWQTMRHFEHAADARAYLASHAPRGALRSTWRVIDARDDSRIA